MTGAGRSHDKAAACHSASREDLARFLAKDPPDHDISFSISQDARLSWTGEWGKPRTTRRVTVEIRVPHNGVWIIHCRDRDVQFVPEGMR